MVFKVFILVRTKPGFTEQACKSIQAISAVAEAIRTIGSWDLLVKVETEHYADISSIVRGKFKPQLA